MGIFSGRADPGDPRHWRTSDRHFQVSFELYFNSSERGPLPYWELANIIREWQAELRDRIYAAGSAASTELPMISPQQFSTLEPNR